MSQEVEQLLARVRSEWRRDPLPAWPRTATEYELRRELLETAHRMRLVRERKRGFVDGLFFVAICALVGISFALFVTAK